MANPGYMTIKGVAQGLISAGCSTSESIGNKYQSNHTDEIMVLSYHHGMANNLCRRRDGGFCLEPGQRKKLVARH